MHLAAPRRAFGTAAAGWAGRPASGSPPWLPCAGNSLELPIDCSGLLASFNAGPANPEALGES